MALLRHWKLQDTAANTVITDAQGLGNGTLVGGTASGMTGLTGPGGQYVRSLVFNGSSQYITFSAVTFPQDTAFTLCAWLKRSSTTTRDTIFGHTSRSEMMGFNSVANGYYLKPTETENADSPPHNRSSTDWALWTFIRETTNDYIKAYRNTEQLSANVMPGERNAEAIYNAIGYAVNYAWHFDGWLAGVRLYDSDESDNVAAIFADVFPVNAVLPVITGAPVVGATLACSAGTWSDGTQSYQWNRSGYGAIDDATDATYVVTADDVGRALSCEVACSNDFGATQVESAAVTARLRGAGGVGFGFGFGF